MQKSVCVYIYEYTHISVCVCICVYTHGMNYYSHKKGILKTKHVSSHLCIRHTLKTNCCTNIYSS